MAALYIFLSLPSVYSDSRNRSDLFDEDLSDWRDVSWLSQEMKER